LKAFVIIFGMLLTFGCEEVPPKRGTASGESNTGFSLLGCRDKKLYEAVYTRDLTDVSARYGFNPQAKKVMDFCSRKGSFPKEYLKKMAIEARDILQKNLETIRKEMHTLISKDDPANLYTLEIKYRNSEHIQLGQELVKTFYMSVVTGKNQNPEYQRISARLREVEIRRLKLDLQRRMDHFTRENLKTKLNSAVREYLSEIYASPLNTPGSTKRQMPQS